MSPRRLLVVLAGLTIVLAACGDDVPTRSDFVDHEVEVLNDSIAKLQQAGLDKATATATVKKFLGCVYDQIEGDGDLLNRVYTESNDDSVISNLSDKAMKACASTLTGAVTPSSVPAPTTTEVAADE